MASAVITRDAAAAASYAAAIAPLGLAAIAMPLLGVRPPADPHALARAIATGDYAHVVVTSARAAHALAHMPPIRGAEVWAVGAATARALAAAGIVARDADTPDGASLARLIIAERAVAGARVLIPRAADGRPDAADLLRAAGAEVDDVIAYAMAPLPADDPALAAGLAALRAGTAPVCAVFAPSQVRALAALVGGLPALATAFVALGHTTAAELRAAGIAAPAIAAVATPQAMAAAVASVYPPRV